MKELVSQSCLTLSTPWTVVHQAPLSVGFSRQEYWSGLPFPPSGDLLDPGIEPVSLMSSALAGGFLSLVPPGKPQRCPRGRQYVRRLAHFSVAGSAVRKPKACPCPDSACQGRIPRLPKERQDATGKNCVCHQTSLGSPAEPSLTLWLCHLGQVI